MSLLSAVPSVVFAVGTALAVELRRLGEVQEAVAEVRAASSDRAPATRPPSRS